MDLFYAHLVFPDEIEDENSDSIIDFTADGGITIRAKDRHEAADIAQSHAAILIERVRDAEDQTSVQAVDHTPESTAR